MLLNKIVLLYGDDGLDPDVLLNQRDLYQNLGAIVIVSSKVLPCDYMVVTRVTSAVDFVNSNYRRLNSIPYILFLDYSGQQCHMAFSLLQHSNKRLITSRKEINGKNVTFGHPYVSIDRWTSRLIDGKRCYNCIHIGNFKKASKSDPLIGTFSEILKCNEIDVFGGFWPQIGKNTRFHGKIDVDEVSDFYSQAVLSIGIKHPFQRGKAISGRYWHATLNGCHLLVEDDYLSDEIPGLIVYKCDTSFSLSQLPKVESPKALKKLARYYWNNSNKIQMSFAVEGLALSKRKYKVIERLIILKTLASQKVKK